MKAMWKIDRTSATLLLALTGPCLAATITVNCLDVDVADDGNCTLREAINAASSNSSSGSAAGECVAGETLPAIDEITFADGLVGTINLTSPLPYIDETVMINGPGADNLAVDGSGLGSASSVHLLEVGPGGAGSEFSGLTFQNATTSN